MRVVLTNKGVGEHDGNIIEEKPYEEKRGDELPRSEGVIQVFFGKFIFALFCLFLQL